MLAHPHLAEVSPPESMELETEDCCENGREYDTADEQ
jgi:hypothetical protein